MTKEILEQAKVLGKLIAASEEVKAANAAKEAYESNAEVQAMITEYNVNNKALAEEYHVGRYTEGHRLGDILDHKSGQIPSALILGGHRASVGHDRGEDLVRADLLSHTVGLDNESDLGIVERIHRSQESDGIARNVVGLIADQHRRQAVLDRGYLQIVHK